MDSKTQKRMVVTGANGFVGKHVVRELHKNGVLVVGIGRQTVADSEISDLLETYYSADLVESWPVVEEVDAVVHLASLAVVGPSFERPQEYINSNSAMVTNIAEHYLPNPSKSPRLIIVSSGATYDPNQKMPLTEESSINFSSPYAVSKVLAENQCQYYRNRGLDCLVARPFNHTGPGQIGDFIVPRLITGLLDASKNNTDMLVGNLSSSRDYTDVRDVAHAYYLLATTPNLNSMIYNVSTGVSTTGKQILDELARILQVQHIRVVVDPARIRPLDPEEIVGDSSRLRKDTGWEPTIELSKTLADCVEGFPAVKN